MLDKITKIRQIHLAKEHQAILLGQNSWSKYMTEGNFKLHIHDEANKNYRSSKKYSKYLEHHNECVYRFSFDVKTIIRQLYKITE